METKILDLHNRALEASTRFRRAESELISILQEMDGHKEFPLLECTSLFDYALRVLKLSEANASNFITVARKSKAIPELKQAIDSGSLTVARARKITPVLTLENKSEWIALAQTLPKLELEKEVARVCPKAAVKERAEYISADRLKLAFGVSEEFMKLLKRVQDLESQRTNRPVKYEESMTAALKVYIEKRDPVEKAKKNCLRSANLVKSSSDLLGVAYSQSAEEKDVHVHGHIPFFRTPLGAGLRHKINLRDEGQCTHEIGPGKRCSTSRWIQVHHIIPIRQGGTNELQNLTTLCSAHHRMKHGH